VAIRGVTNKANDVTVTGRINAVNTEMAIIVIGAEIGSSGISEIDAHTASIQFGIKNLAFAEVL
jgi:hypothetical protein